MKKKDKLGLEIWTYSPHLKSFGEEMMQGRKSWVVHKTCFEISKKLEQSKNTLWSLGLAILL